MKVQDITNRFEEFAPKTLAFPRDPIGLQIGDLNQEISKILVTLDVRPNVVEEAITNGCNMIFSHHPVMFRPAQSLDLTIAQNKMYADIIKNDITVYSAHTNLDVVEEGMNDWLADKIGLSQKTTLETPNGNIGKFGMLKSKVSISDFSEFLKKQFNLDGIRVVSDRYDKDIQKVAVIGGDGGKFYPEVIAQNCDAFITGDVYYHTGHDMESEGLTVFDVGHNVEKICIPKLSQLFNQWKNEAQWNVEIVESKVNTNPYRFF